MFPQINFQWVPMALVITNSFARRADGQQAAQGLDLVECLPKLLNEPLALSFRLLPLGFVSLAFGPLFGLSYGLLHRWKEPGQSVFHNIIRSAHFERFYRLLCIN